VSREAADVVILGAGVTGASIAFHLARRGAGRVVVLDKGELAHGGSGRSSALVRMHYSFPPEVQLARKSLEYFEHWPEIVGRPGDFRKTGFVRIVPEAERGRLEANVAMQRALGVDARVVTAGELREIAPAWRFDDGAAAAWEPGSGYGDGAGVAGDFLARAREMGVVFRPRTAVSAIRVEQGRVRGVEVDGGALDAPVVAAATGPWTRPLLAAAGVPLPIEPEYHEVAILKNPPGLATIGPAGIDSPCAVYYRAEPGGRTLVGGFYGRRGADPDDFPQTASTDGLESLAAAAARRIPALEDAGLARGITGIYDMSPDARPLLGEVPQASGLFVAAGFSGMGFKLSPAVGLVMSERILDGRATSIDITAFRPGRFAEGRPIKAEYEYADD
jgi:glycine/D-amino acid oxidase-like deaminating enzyme